MNTFSPTITRPVHRSRSGGFAPFFSSRSVSALRDGLAKGLERLNDWQAQARTRRQLSYLGDDALKDIGIGRSEAYSEYSKPFWRV